MNGIEATADLLVDTDIFIDHLRGARQLPVLAGMHYSVITRCELFAGRYVDETVVRQLLGALVELPVTREIAEHAGQLRRASSMRMPDALIAATALTHSLDLATRNSRDFAHVPSLSIRAI